MVIVIPILKHAHWRFSGGLMTLLRKNQLLISAQSTIFSVLWRYIPISRTCESLLPDYGHTPMYRGRGYSRDDLHMTYMTRGACLDLEDGYSEIRCVAWKSCVSDLLSAFLFLMGLQ